ncbi:MAG: hypothetical protein AAGN35_01475 [Bacteroidota bacterium]
MPLIADIELITGGNSACDILEIPVNALRSAANSLDNMKNNPPAAIRDLTAELEALTPPQIPGVDALAAGIASVKDKLPNDAGDLTQPLADAINDFFGTLEENFAGKLDDMIGGLTGLGHVAGLAMGASPLPEDLDDTLDSLEVSLNVLPSPLTVESLLTFINAGLENFPRTLFKNRYIPIIDELRDKLGTTLRWKAMNGQEIADELENTLLKLAQVIRATFIGNCLDPVLDDLQRFNDSIDEPALTTALDGMTSSLTTVRQAVEAGDISAVTSDVAALLEYRTFITNALGNVDAQTIIFRNSLQEIERMDTELEDRVVHFLSLIQPNNDLRTFYLLLAPLAEQMNTQSIEVIVDKLGEYLGSFSGILKGINLNSVKDDFISAMEAAADGIESLRTTMMEMTISFSAMMEEVKDTLDGLGLDGIVTTMESGLNNFTATVENAADQLFGPVQDFFKGIFQNIRDFLAQLDPDTIVAALRDIISQFTDLLSNPQLLEAIDQVKQAIDDVNAEIAQFSFKPGADVVIEGIDKVEQILKKLATLEIPDFLKIAVQLALDQINPTLDPVVDALVDELEKIIDEGPRKVLLQVKVGPQKLVDIISRYSPENLVADCIGPAFQDLLTEMTRFKPSSLLEPIQAALDAVKEQVQRLGDPETLLAPLDEPFMEVIGILDAFDPEEIISPLDDAMQNGVQTILEILPLGAANAVFDQIAGLGLIIQALADKATRIQSFIDGLRIRLSGLQGAQQQMQAISADIASRIDAFTDISGVTTAMDEVSLALADIHSASLTAEVNNVLNPLIAKVQSLQVKPKLAAIASALTSFPLEQLASLPPSLNKTNLEAFLTQFDPTVGQIAAPAELLDTLPAAVASAREDFDELMLEWNDRHLEANGPIMALYQPTLTAAELRTMLKDTMENELTRLLEPFMIIVERLEGGARGLALKLTDVIDGINDLLDDLTDITDAVEELRTALDDLVETFLSFNLNFISESFGEIFDALRNQLMGLLPSGIAEALSDMYKDLLGLLDVTELLDASALDAEFLAIIDLLRGLDPSEIIVNALQPEFEKVLEFILRFDLSVQIDAFLEQIDRLIDDLRTELDRVSVKYEDMWQAVPSNLSGGVSASLSVATSLF